MGFDFGNANAEQIKAITTTEGPVLIVAGPGTGKTFTLVKRAMYLIQEKKVLPEEIMMVTFTDKAAKELVTRLTNELAVQNISVNLQDMYVGTFHSICLRIIKDNLEYTRLRKNYRMLDQFDQKYSVFREYSRFAAIENIDKVIKGNIQNRDAFAEQVCTIVNKVEEELICAEELICDDKPEVVAFGRLLHEYDKFLHEGDYLDFTSIQTDCYKLLKENKTVLNQLQSKIKYIMIDEYQDTNYIQEQLVLLLGMAGKETNNICVVGDDDQSLYRFRGATVRNILEFDQIPNLGDCKIIKLETNYRSNHNIVDFYNKWMSITDSGKNKFSWTMGGKKFRRDKLIKTGKKTAINSPAVIKVSAQKDEDLWHSNIFDFITKVKEAKENFNYNQIAFLFNSVSSEKVKNLANYLEANGINVYSPRSELYFQREEIRLAIGCLLCLLPAYVSKIDAGSYPHYIEKEVEYYKNCIKFAVSTLNNPAYKELKQWILKTGIKHANLKENTDYAYAVLLYQMFSFEPFKSYLGIDLEHYHGVVDERPARNLAMLTQLIGKYEYLHSIKLFSTSSFDQDTDRLFNVFLRMVYKDGLGEYEDDSEYAPSGCVSFLTIHQSKGMEFPIVIVDSLANNPTNRATYNYALVESIISKYGKKEVFEPLDKLVLFDFWRLYYTAFSRAQDLLVLTCIENGKRSPSAYFGAVYPELKEYKDEAFDINEFEFEEIKDVNIKETYSFTSQISVYETCSLQYKFYKELGFQPVRAGAILFGTLVHETIEDIHRAVLRNEIDLISTPNITKWFNVNYESLAKKEHTYLGTEQKIAALKQVLRYVEHKNGYWDDIRATEVDVSLVKPEYILEGKIDLIKGDNDTVEIVDFKSEKKPDLFNSDNRLEHYKRQLNVYAYLVEERYGKKVSKMHLYYTGEESGNPMITIPYTKTAVDGTIAAFDSTVKKILKHDYSTCATANNTCKNCDFRFYCKKN